LLRVTLDQAADAADRSGGKSPGQQRPDQSAEAVDPEQVERIVVAEAVLQLVSVDRARRRCGMRRVAEI
jgi:hypothetical protein